MKTIVALSLFTALSASAATQNIKCYTRGAMVELSLELSRSNSIVGGEALIKGPDIAEDVWRGLSGEVEKEQITVKNGKMNIHVETWNPSWDDPDSYDITFERAIIGKSLKKGSFNLTVEHDGSEVTFDKKECYSFVKR